MRTHCQFTVKRSPKCAVRSTAASTAATSTAAAAATATQKAASAAATTVKFYNSEQNNAEYYNHPNDYGNALFWFGRGYAENEEFCW
jgi:hypothetical protein|tara:strand:- start:361 stop:621 length:261 start_codon:yes stop_codon:yes gene_type:complete